MALVPIIMGSKSDLSVAESVRDALTALGIRSEMRVASAHKSAAHVLEILSDYEARDAPIVYVTIAGRSNALGGMVDANVTAPVVTCPPYSDRFGGADIFSSLRMPSGVVAAPVLDPKNAALLAAKILAMAVPALKPKIAAVQRANTARILTDDEAVRAS